MERPTTTYDLLPSDKKNDTFRVTFDLLTPRPHFILLPKPGVEMSMDHSLESNQKQKLIKAARDMLSSWNIDFGTLSIHRGSWISGESQTAHFHLCVDAQKYLAIFDEEKTTNFVKWFDTPLDALVWKKKYLKYYPTRVKAYPGEKYHAGAVAEIMAMGNMGDSSTPEVLYHPKHPKIGFLGGQNEDDNFENILTNMEQYATSNNLSENGGGFHLCLNLKVCSDSGTYVLWKILIKCAV